VRLFAIHSSIVDPETRRQSRLLSVCLAVLTPSFLWVDVVLSLFTADHKPPLLGYGFLIGTFVLNRPLATLTYIALGPMLGAIFVSMRVEADRRRMLLAEIEERCGDRADGARRRS
jgi:hypothetical protein